MEELELNIDSNVNLIKSPNHENINVYKCDFNDIYDLYFRDIIFRQEYKTTPSGVFISYSDAAYQIPSFNIKNNLVTNYIIDDNYMSVETRKNIFKFIEVKEDAILDFDSVTISPSVSQATAIILLMLKEKGVKKFYSVTPLYFSIMEQARYLEYDISLFCGSHKDNYYCEIKTMINSLPKITPFILVLFNPRYPLGDNINTTYLEELLSKLNDNAYLIIDEAQDRSFPSHLRNIHRLTKANVFRVFGIFKCLGLHGAKGAIIQHHTKYRKRITEISETIGGTLDKYSESLLNFFASNSNAYLNALECVDKQVQKNYNILKLLMDEEYTYSRNINNGFLGAIIIDTKGIDYFRFRNRLLLNFKKEKSPIAIGSTQYFPYDGTKELIRINYFQKPLDFEKSVLTINRCINDVFKTYL